MKTLKTLFGLVVEAGSIVADVVANYRDLPYAGRHLFALVRFHVRTWTDGRGTLAAKHERKRELIDSLRQTHKEWNAVNPV